MFTLTLEGFRPRRTRPFPALPAEHARHSPSSFTNRQTFQHSNLLTLREPSSFRIHTSAKRACNSRRIRTSKTQDLKRFRMNTYGKTRGEGPATEGTPTDRLLPKSSSATLLSRSTQTGDPVASFTLFSHPSRTSLKIKNFHPHHLQPLTLPHTPLLPTVLITELESPALM